MLIPIIVLYICDVIFGNDILSKPNYDVDNAIDYFEDFIKSHDKNYANEEEKQKRFEIFKETLKEINKLNCESERAIFDINTYSDLTKEEFAYKFTGFKQDFRRSGSDCLGFTDEDIKTKTAPKGAFDWRKHHVVTAIKNQDQCGSCWAVSTTGMIEGQLAIKHDTLISLSVQQLVDCVEGSTCYGGDQLRAVSNKHDSMVYDPKQNNKRLPVGITFTFALHIFRTTLVLQSHQARDFDKFVLTALKSESSTLIEQGGQMSDDDYPYIQEKTTCKFDKTKVVVNVTESHEFNLKKEINLKELLYTTGPVVVGLNMEKLTHYKGGIFMYSECGDNDEPNHAVLLVGYGTEQGIPHWILKNSYTENWGENGYFRLEYGKNTCGLMKTPVVTAIIE